MRSFATLPRNAAIVAAFNTLLALSITLVQRDSGLLDNFVFSQCIGLLVYLTVDLLRRAFWPRGTGSFGILLALAALGMLVGYFGGTALAAAILGYPWQPAAVSEPDAAKTVVLTLWGGLLGSWFFWNRARLANARAHTEAVERRALEAQLRMLQAQIEPHFLFNTLANLDALIAHVAASGAEALEKLLELAPEVAFLDIRMPGLSGLEVAEELADRIAPGARPPALVFVTAYDEFALKAFDLAATDYLLKPVAMERLARCVARLQSSLAQPAGLDALLAQLRALTAAPPAAEPLRHIQAGVGNAVRIIPLDEVCYFRAGDKYTSVATRDGAEALIRTPLKELLARLPAERFRQVHRGSIVNLDQVAEALRDEVGRVSLRLKHRKETLPVSRLYVELFRQM